MSRRATFALLACLAATGCAQNGADGMRPRGDLTEMSLATARAAESSGNYSQSAAILAAAYDRAPSAQVAAKLGRARRLGGDAQGAVVILQEADRKFPNNAALLEELGRAAMDGGYMPEASQALAHASALPDAAWTTFLAYGALQARNHDFAGAEASFHKARSMAPSIRDGYAADADLALLRAEKGDLRGAISEMESLAQRPGVDPKIQADLAMLYGLSGDQAGLHRVATRTQSGAAIEQWLSGSDAVPRQEAARPRPDAAASTNHMP